MSWDDREYAEDPMRKMGRPGGDWKGMTPTWDNPMTWAFPLFRLAGITVRVHFFFVLFVVIMLLRAAFPDKLDPHPVDVDIMATSMACLFIIVLAHEFGHCLACRLSGGQADEILMWPLGGLAYCQPPNRWKAHLITAIGGPAVNVVLCAACTLMLGVITNKWWGVAIPNPLDFNAGYNDPSINSWALSTLFITNVVSLILLLFNLLPTFPLDGGRIVQAALWPRLGYSRSMHLAVITGYVGAFLLGVYGAVVSRWTLVGIAIFGGVTCWMTHRQLRWTNEMMGFEDDEYALSLTYGQKMSDSDTTETSPQSARQSKAAAKQAQREQEEAAEVDRILQKIAENGMSSLSKAEKKLLEQATARKRQQQS